MKKIMTENLDVADELRGLSNIRITAYQQRISKSYKNNIPMKRFQVGDLSIEKFSKIQLNIVKRNLQWKGPYHVDYEVGKRAHQLSSLDGKILSRFWNAIHLKTYFA